VLTSWVKGVRAAKALQGRPSGAIMNLAYFWYDAAHMMLAPARVASDMTKLMLSVPGNPLSYTTVGRSMTAACEMFERTTRRYDKPAFGLTTTLIDGERVPVTEEIIWRKPFCDVIAFRRGPTKRPKKHPKLLIVAPMSGHHATLLRGTVEGFLPNHEVMITDWKDASEVPLIEGGFDLDTYIDYLEDMYRDLGPDLHVLAVCQPSVPALAAVALMEAANDPAVPRSLTMMGGPVDTRRSPTAVNLLAEERGVPWFRANCIKTVPLGHPGAMREVYPGFFQLTGFMAMNLDRHVTAHRDMFNHLVRGDGDLAEKHRDFYDEYMAVMDLTSEFYLQTVEKVFVTHALPKGELMHRDIPVDLLAIRTCAIMAVEGEKDDISGVGQTKAALDLTPNLSSDKKAYHLQMGVGHYGVFNGSRFRAEIAPRIRDFILTHQTGASARPAPTPSAPIVAEPDAAKSVVEPVATAEPVMAAVSAKKAPKRPVPNATLSIDEAVAAAAPHAPQALHADLVSSTAALEPGLAPAKRKAGEKAVGKGKAKINSVH
jgi:poly(3-hydroxybutyrate) depolymerase